VEEQNKRAKSGTAKTGTGTGFYSYRYTYDYRPSTPLGAVSASSAFSTVSLSNGLSNGNRLTKVESKTTGAYSTVAQYLYDGLNRRVKRDKSGLADDVVYLYDNWRACPP